MRRRAPPSSLRLFQGPLPPRSQPKHTLPSVPRPVFRPETLLRCGPSPVARTREGNAERLVLTDLAPLSPEQASGSHSTPTTSPVAKRVWGPWDDCVCFDVVVDVDSILALPKPVAMAM